MEMTRYMTKRPRFRSADIQAYTCFQQGRRLSREWMKTSVEKARRLFERAVKLDAGYAAALGGLAVCDAFLREWRNGSAPNGGYAIRALERDPLLPEARALELLREDRSDDARREFARAMAIEPDCYETNVFYALFCRSVGDYETAIRHYVDAAASFRRTTRRRTL
ncbi:tetratricopeptide repeat protein [Sinorhizobium fredii]|uniref:tetratricopeptide repeat protein n=1 Tax=Rhizobium fredii TaxID=380 RepID=UPI0005955D03|nr:hypothetical protein [Sinorhizobium fredii]WOS66130.1 hypothetical protein SFGR64A_20710 [Sinorhizobium fredii GR64]